MNTQTMRSDILFTISIDTRMEWSIWSNLIGQNVTTMVEEGYHRFRGLEALRGVYRFSLHGIHGFVGVFRETTFQRICWFQWHWFWVDLESQCFLYIGVNRCRGFVGTTTMVLEEASIVRSLGVYKHWRNMMSNCFGGFR